MAAGDNQKLKMLYLVKIFSDQTDDEHGLTLQEIAARLGEYGVNADCPRANVVYYLYSMR